MKAIIVKVKKKPMSRKELLKKYLAIRGIQNRRRFIS